jgi:outer membrane murein-binding lipoprotein Lpp
MFAKRNFVLPAILVLSIFVLTACGSAYVDALNPAIDEFNSAANAFNAQLDIVNADNGKFTDPEWVAKTETTLAAMRGAGQALKNLPEPDSSDYNRLNSLVQQLADASINFADKYGAAINAGNISLTDDADPYMDKINELLPQINAEVSRLDG